MMASDRVYLSMVMMCAIANLAGRVCFWKIRSMHYLLQQRRLLQHRLVVVGKVVRLLKHLPARRLRQIPPWPLGRKARALGEFGLLATPLFQPLLFAIRAPITSKLCACIGWCEQ